MRVGALGREAAGEKMILSVTLGQNQMLPHPSPLPRLRTAGGWGRRTGSWEPSHPTLWNCWTVGPQVRP